MDADNKIQKEFYPGDLVFFSAKRHLIYALNKSVYTNIVLIISTRKLSPKSNTGIMTVVYNCYLPNDNIYINIGHNRLTELSTWRLPT